MKPGDLEFLKGCLTNLQVDITTASYNTVGPHWRDIDFVSDFNRFYLICSGEGYVKIGNKEFYPKPGQMMLLPAGAKLSYSTISEQSFSKYWCHFTASVGQLPFFQLVDLSYAVEPLELNKTMGLFEDLKRQFQKQDLPSLFRVKAIALELISIFISSQEARASILPPSNQKIHKILEYIDAHLSETITVEQLADLVHFHPNYFIPFFKNVMGVSPIQYINRVKIEKGKQLLAASDMNVSEIAETIGMNNHYFSRAFKQYTGYSPTYYRNMFQKTADASLH
ncbi:AraC family transcriptional regulator [Ammoniphilus sp. YIM 78166]|uniref:AraC family transcriptional regulator n=1 Tax=Ammoniphilus sp. YIM 78166 TaxID=1644106 RepID=UPI00106FD51E|nr:AraC family transcriptional regulator [Ammoniphilus sp. YIM 78166]